MDRNTGIVEGEALDGVTQSIVLGLIGREDASKHLSQKIKTFKINSLTHQTLTGHLSLAGARCSSVVRAFAHGAIGSLDRRIDPS